MNEVNEKVNATPYIKATNPLLEYAAGFGGTYDHMTTSEPVQYWHPGGQVNHGPTDNEIRLRESAIALTIEYFKASGTVNFPDFNQQLEKFYLFLQTGKATADGQAVELGF